MAAGGAATVKSESAASMAAVCLGGSTVLATGSFGWQYNASNGVVFVGVLARILVFVRRRIGTAVVSFVGHRRLGCM